MYIGHLANLGDAFATPQRTWDENQTLSLSSFALATDSSSSRREQWKVECPAKYEILPPPVKKAARANATKHVSNHTQAVCHMDTYVVGVLFVAVVSLNHSY